MRTNVILQPEHKQIIEDYGRRHNMLATTGRKTGEVNTSAVIQHALENLVIVERLRELQTANGST